jgi:hypothetical protein
MKSFVVIQNFVEKTPTWKTEKEIKGNNDMDLRDILRTRGKLKPVQEKEMN